MKLDDMLKMCGLENAEMSDMAKIKSHLVVKCINCGNKMRVNDIRTHPPSPLMEVLVAPCGMCLKRFVGEQEE